ncbi:hypothetical protein Nepgr_009826 [Nepenthes gracilis]|uniref:YTH domain-containing family protein n=1 Tax=Nepenthes gracilis TaxID=150966 RepID=A0AAD3SC39_NEPGR|nr:hypothetical protein Nepgr_009826 [Nepenthes gracilis]
MVKEKSVMDSSSPFLTRKISASTSRFSLNPYNLPDFPSNHDNVEFFVIKSFSENNVPRSLKYGVWASTPHGNRKLIGILLDYSLGFLGVTIPVPFVLRFGFRPSWTVPRFGHQINHRSAVSMVSSGSVCCPAFDGWCSRPGFTSYHFIELLLEVNSSAQFCGVAQNGGIYGF